jgi:hypothetical protein
VQSSFLNPRFGEVGLAKTSAAAERFKAMIPKRQESLNLPGMECSQGKAVSGRRYSRNH